MWSFVTLSRGIMFSRFVYVLASNDTSFIFFLNNIPLYGYTTFNLSIHHLIDIRLFLPISYYE